MRNLGYSFPITQVTTYTNTKPIRILIPRNRYALVSRTKTVNDFFKDKCCANDSCQSTIDLTKHHLIPRTRWDSKGIKSKYSKNGLENLWEPICKDCHDILHKKYSNKKLASFHLRGIELKLLCFNPHSSNG